MKKTNKLQRVSVSLVTIFVLLGMSMSAQARVTVNPVELIVDGGFTFNRDVSKTTKLFIDVAAPGKPSQFWVRVEDNPGVPPESAPVEATLDANGEILLPVPTQPTKSVFIKYFPNSRYLEVLRAVRGIQNYGTVNPYVEDFVICDAPNSTIRSYYRTVVMAYNCGSDGPNADESTFAAEALIKALSDETMANPDLQGTAPQ